MGASWRRMIAPGALVGLLATVSIAAADAEDHRGAGDQAATELTGSSESAGNADLIGTWVAQPALKNGAVSVRFKRREGAQIACLVLRGSGPEATEDPCDLTRSGNYLTIFVRTPAAPSAKATPQALFVTLESGEMVGRMVSGEVSEIRLRVERTDQDLRDSGLQRQEAAALAGAESERQAQAAQRAEAESLRRAKVDAEAGAEFPVMVRIPGGSFMMGFPDGEGGRFEAEATLHKVSIRAFELAKYAVTFAQWDACVTDGGCTGYRPDDRGWGRGSRPVINVSWDDAQLYVRWLSAKSGKRFRLPSEAEWEYASRAGTTTARYWGDKIGSGNANCSGCGSQWDGKETAPVGSFKPNAFGLYDMLGNVWQWTADCYRDSYDGAPVDGSAVAGDADCGLRVARGGAWNVVGPASVRSGYRSRNDRALRFASVGFRVARSLP